MTRNWLPVFRNKLVEIEEGQEELTKQIDTEIANPSRKGLPYPLRFYDFFYWCTRGGHWLKKEDAVEDGSGRITCPIHNARVRTKRKHVNRYETDERKRVEIR